MSTTTPAGFSVRDGSNADQQIRGVIAGTDGHDAVNVDQLTAAIAAITFSIPDSAVAFGPPGGGLPIGDAADFSYVNASNTLKLGATGGGIMLVNVSAAPNADTVVHLSSKGSGANQRMYFQGGGGPAIPDAGDHLFFAFGPAFAQDVASNADPHYLTMALFQRPTYNAVGIGGANDSNMLGDRAAATVAIAGPPLLTGNWGTGATTNALSFWVQQGNSRFGGGGDLIVGNLTGTDIFRASAAGFLGFWGGPGQGSKPTVTGTRADAAALASLLTIGATYGLWTDSSTAGTAPGSISIADSAVAFGPPGGGIPIGDAANFSYDNPTNALSIGSAGGGSLSVNGNVTANAIILDRANTDVSLARGSGGLFLAEAKAHELLQDSGTGAFSPALLVQAGQHLSVPAGGDYRQVQVNLADQQWLGGSDVAAWRAMHVLPPSISFQSGPRSFGSVATFAIGGAPTTGVNVLATSSNNALWVEGGQVRFDFGPLVMNVDTPTDLDGLVHLSSRGGGSRQGMFFAAGGGAQVQNAANHAFFTFGPAFPQDVASNADPHYMTMAKFSQPIYNAVGIGAGADSSLLGDRAAATVAIVGAPLLTGNWGTGSTGNTLAFWVESGNARFSQGDLIVGDLTGTQIMRVGSSGFFSFWGAAGISSKPVVSGAKGGNAAVASLMAALASYGLVTDATGA